MPRKYRKKSSFKTTKEDIYRREGRELYEQAQSLQNATTSHQRISPLRTRNLWERLVTALYMSRVPEDITREEERHKPVYYMGRPVYPNQAIHPSTIVLPQDHQQITEAQAAQTVTDGVSIDGAVTDETDVDEIVKDDTVINEIDIEKEFEDAVDINKMNVNAINTKDTGVKQGLEDVIDVDEMDVEEIFAEDTEENIDEAQREETSAGNGLFASAATVGAGVITAFTGLWRGGSEVSTVGENIPMMTLDGYTRTSTLLPVYQTTTEANPEAGGVLSTLALILLQRLNNIQTRNIMEGVGLTTISGSVLYMLYKILTGDSRGTEDEESILTEEDLEVLHSPEFQEVLKAIDQETMERSVYRKAILAKEEADEQVKAKVIALYDAIKKARNTHTIDPTLAKILLNENNIELNNNQQIILGEEPILSETTSEMQVTEIRKDQRTQIDKPVLANVSLFNQDKTNYPRKKRQVVLDEETISGIVSDSSIDTTTVSTEVTSGTDTSVTRQVYWKKKSQQSTGKAKQIYEELTAEEKLENPCVAPVESFPLKDQWYTLISELDLDSLPEAYQKEIIVLIWQLANTATTASKEYGREFVDLAEFYIELDAELLNRALLASERFDVKYAKQMKDVADKVFILIKRFELVSLSKVQHYLVIREENQEKLEGSLATLELYYDDSYKIELQEIIKNYSSLSIPYPPLATPPSVNVIDEATRLPPTIISCIDFFTSYEKKLADILNIGQYDVEFQTELLQLIVNLVSENIIPLSFSFLKVLNVDMVDFHFALAREVINHAIDEYHEEDFDKAESYYTVHKTMLALIQQNYHPFLEQATDIFYASISNKQQELEILKADYDTNSSPLITKRDLHVDEIAKKESDKTAKKSRVAYRAYVPKQDILNVKKTNTFFGKINWNTFSGTFRDDMLKLMESLTLQKDIQNSENNEQIDIAKFYVAFDKVLTRRQIKAYEDDKWSLVKEIGKLKKTLNRIMRKHIEPYAPAITSYYSQRGYDKAEIVTAKKAARARRRQAERYRVRVGNVTVTTKSPEVTTKSPEVTTEFPKITTENNTDNEKLSVVLTQQVEAFFAMLQSMSNPVLEPGVYTANWVQKLINTHITDEKVRNQTTPDTIVQVYTKTARRIVGGDGHYKIIPSSQVAIGNYTLSEIASGIYQDKTEAGDIYLGEELKELEKPLEQSTLQADALKEVEEFNTPTNRKNLISISNVFGRMAALRYLNDKEKAGVSSTDKFVEAVNGYLKGSRKPLLIRINNAEGKADIVPQVVFIPVIGNNNVGVMLSLIGDSSYYEVDYPGLRTEFSRAGDFVSWILGLPEPPSLTIEDNESFQAFMLKHLSVYRNLQHQAGTLFTYSSTLTEGGPDSSLEIFTPPFSTIAVGDTDTALVDAYIRRLKKDYDTINTAPDEASLARLMKRIQFWGLVLGSVLIVPGLLGALPAVVFTAADIAINVLTIIVPNIILLDDEPDTPELREQYLSEIFNAIMWQAVSEVGAPIAMEVLKPVVSTAVKAVLTGVKKIPELTRNIGLSLKMALNKIPVERLRVLDSSGVKQAKELTTEITDLLEDIAKDIEVSPSDPTPYEALENLQKSLNENEIQTSIRVVNQWKEGAGKVAKNEYLLVGVDEEVGYTFVAKIVKNDDHTKKIVFQGENSWAKSVALKAKEADTTIKYRDYPTASEARSAVGGRMGKVQEIADTDYIEQGIVLHPSKHYRTSIEQAENVNYDVLQQFLKSIHTKGLAEAMAELPVKKISDITEEAKFPNFDYIGDASKVKSDLSKSTSTVDNSLVKPLNPKWQVKNLVLEESNFIESERLYKVRPEKPESANHWNYFIKQDDAAYQIRSDDDKRTWRVVNPATPGRFNYAAPVRLNVKNDRWEINFDLSGAGGGWGEVKTNVRSMGKNLAQGVTDWFINSKEYATKIVDDAIWVLNKSLKNDVEDNVDEVIKIFFGRSNETKKQKLLEQLKKTKNYLKNLTSSSQLTYSGGYSQSASDSFMKTMAGVSAEGTSKKELATVYYDALVDAQDKLGLSQVNRDRQLGIILIHEVFHALSPAQATKDLAFPAFVKEGVIDIGEVVKIARLSESENFSQVITRVDKNPDNFAYGITLLGLMKKNPELAEDFITRYQNWDKTSPLEYKIGSSDLPNEFEKAIRLEHSETGKLISGDLSPLQGGGVIQSSHMEDIGIPFDFVRSDLKAVTVAPITIHSVKDFTINHKDGLANGLIYMRKGSKIDSQFMHHKAGKWGTKAFLSDDISVLQVNNGFAGVAGVRIKLTDIPENKALIVNAGQLTGCTMVYAVDESYFYAYHTGKPDSSIPDWYTGKNGVEEIYNVHKQFGKGSFKRGSVENNNDLLELMQQEYDKSVISYFGKNEPGKPSTFVTKSQPNAESFDYAPDSTASKPTTIGFAFAVLSKKNGQINVNALSEIEFAEVSGYDMVMTLELLRSKSYNLYSSKTFPDVNPPIKQGPPFGEGNQFRDLPFIDEVADAEIELARKRLLDDLLSTPKAKEDLERITRFPAGNCDKAAAKILALLSGKGYETKVIGVLSYKNVQDTIPMDHYVVLASKNGNSLVIDSTFVQFLATTKRELVITSLEKWEQALVNSDHLRNQLVISKEYPTLAAAKNELGMFDRVIWLESKYVTDSSFKVLQMPDFFISRLKAIYRKDIEFLNTVNGLSDVLDIDKKIEKQRADLYVLLQREDRLDKKGKVIPDKLADDIQKAKRKREELLSLSQLPERINNYLELIKIHKNLRADDVKISSKVYSKLANSKLIEKVPNYKLLDPDAPTVVAISSDMITANELLNIPNLNNSNKRLLTKAKNKITQKLSDLIVGEKSEDIWNAVKEKLQSISTFNKITMITNTQNTKKHVILVNIDNILLTIKREENGLVISDAFEWLNKNPNIKFFNSLSELNKRGYAYTDIYDNIYTSNNGNYFIKKNGNYYQVLWDNEAKSWFFYNPNTQLVLPLDVFSEGIDIPGLRAGADTESGVIIRTLDASAFIELPINLKGKIKFWLAKGSQRVLKGKIVANEIKFERSNHYKVIPHSTSAPFTSKLKNQLSSSIIADSIKSQRELYAKLNHEFREYTGPQAETIRNNLKLGGRLLESSIHGSLNIDNVYNFALVKGDKKVTEYTADDIFGYANVGDRFEQERPALEANTVVAHPLTLISKNDEAWKFAVERGIVEDSLRENYLIKRIANQLFYESLQMTFRDIDSAVKNTGRIAPEIVKAYAINAITEQAFRQYGFVDRRPRRPS